MSNPQIGERSIRRLVGRWEEVLEFIKSHNSWHNDPVKAAQVAAFRQCIEGARGVISRAKTRRKKK